MSIIFISRIFLSFIKIKMYIIDIYLYIIKMNLYKFVIMIFNNKKCSY